jgi:SAM-dependent methyltransferase
VGLAQFVREYTTVRRAEGWGSADPTYYRALPYRDLTGRFSEIWRIRAASFELFLERVVEPLERERTRPLKIVDIGAGSGWLADRLARRGHWVAAIDVLEDPLDGLGAIHRYSRDVQPVLAEFDHLPLPAGTLDAAVFNAAFHYSTDYATTLRETLRVLQPRGTLVILDSPMYSDPNSGARMVQEREARFLKTYGFSSAAVPSEHYLTSKRLDDLAKDVGLTWQVHWPRLDVRIALSRKMNGLRARREPARFPVIVGTRA